MTVSAINREINGYIEELRLSAMKECYEEYALKAENEKDNYKEYLLALLKEESYRRKTNRTQRYLKESLLPLEKNFDMFDMDRVSLKLKRITKELCEGGFLDRKENVLVFGKPGSGKTHLLCAIGQELIYKNRRVYFTQCGKITEMLLKAKKELKLDTALKKLAKFQALIIDDIGYVQYSREQMEVLFSLLAYRYETGSVMITSNLPFSKWDQIFKDQMTTAAAIDRLVHHSVIIEMNMDSYRMEQANKKKEVMGKE